MAGKIFINYRRGDDPGYTQALYQRLEDEFAAANLFMDVEGHIKPGDDFINVLNTQVATADVLLAIIGPRWTELLAVRANDPDDFVAIEIKAALDRDKRVIPVLVGGATMPKPDILPEAIRPLARRNAVGLRPERFKADCQGLVTALKEQLTAAEQERLARTEVERRAAEAARIEAEAQASARAKAAEERSRAQAAAGLSAEEIRKAEELASWQFVERRGEIADLRDHLARFPGGTTERYALAKLEELVWAGLGAAPDLAGLKAYIDEFPKGMSAEAARDQIEALERQLAKEKANEEARLRETAAWAEASSLDTQAAYEAYLSDWPKGDHVTPAKSRKKELARGPARPQLYIGLGLGALMMAGAGLYLLTFQDDVTRIKTSANTGAGPAGHDPLPLGSPGFGVTDTSQTLLLGAAKAEFDRQQAEAAKPKAPEPSASALAAIDKRLQQTAHWPVLKRTFPNWYSDRVLYAAGQKAEQRSDDQINQALAEQIVALRRQNVSEALAASAPKLRALASAFLENLKELKSQSTTTCYNFVSRGETTPGVVSLLQATSKPPPALQLQIAAIFDAINDGKTSPVKHERPVKSDFDVLMGQLSKIGWTQNDVATFADPDKLAKAAPDQVCKMVQDWFVAHLAIPDAAVQERLLSETLRPVVAG